MLRNRIIFSLIYNNGYFMQSRNFRLQKVGDIGWLEKNYQFQKVSFSLDELIILDASRSGKNLGEFCKVVSRLAEKIYIPITAGGGINSVLDAELLFKSGADKVIVNSALYDNTEIVRDIIKQYGSQSLVASIDYKVIDGKQIIFIENGQVPVEQTMSYYIKYLNKLNVGEIYLNSIDKDGTGFGYDFKTINKYVDSFDMPLIVAGGAGNDKHFLEALQQPGITSVATANLFNFIGDGLPNARKFLLGHNTNLATWL